MKKCKKCWLTPDICGAKCDESCDKLYENKWSFRWALFKEYASFGFVLILLVFSIGFFFVSLTFGCFPFEFIADILKIDIGGFYE